MTNPMKTQTRCEVVDQIIEWTNPEGVLQICKGDLVLENGRFELVADIRVMSNGFRIEYSLQGCVGLRSAAPDGLVAVRRYVETNAGVLR